MPEWVQLPYPVRCYKMCYNHFMTTKICSQCKEEKPLEEFAKTTRNGKPLIRGKCRPCFNIYYREWYQNHKDEHKARVYGNRNQTNRRWSRHGLTEDEFNELIKSNGGLCHLCNKDVATAIDHCHTTGRVRGHLCIRCNTGLGKLGDSADTLRKAVEYLERADWK